MWTIRIWLIVLAALVASSLGVASLLARPFEREMALASGYKLDLVQHNAHLLIKLDQRERIDIAARMARDPRIADALAEVSSGKADLGRAQAATNAALLDLLAQIPADARPELCIAVDQAGFQISRIGAGQARIEPRKYGIGGFPLVAEALRGLLRDDTWSLDGKLYLMAAAPVVQQPNGGETRSGGSYVGALVLGQEVNGAYAQRLKDRLVATHMPPLARTDVAFFLRGTALAATTATKPLEKLPLQFVRHKSEYLRAGRSAALRIGTPPAANVVVIAPLPGEASEHDAFYAIVSPAPQAVGLWARISSLRPSDASGASLWLGLGALWAVLVGVGLVLIYAQVDVPSRRFVADLRRLSRSELNRLTPHQYAAGYEVVAQLVNDTVDRVQKRKPAPASAQNEPSQVGREEVPGGGLPLEPRRAPTGGALPPNLGATTLGSPPSRPNVSMPPLARPSAEALPPLAPAGPRPVMAGPPNTRSPADTPLALEPAAITPAALYQSAEDAVTDHLAPHHPGPPGGMGLTRAPASDFDADLPLLKPIDLPPGDDEEQYEADTVAETGPTGSTIQFKGIPAAHTPIERVSLADAGAEPKTLGDDKGAGGPPPLLDEESETVMSSVPLHLARSIRDRTPTPAIESADPAEAERAAFDEHLEQVYREFVNIKRSCGEPTESLTFDRFANKLRKNRDTLMEKYDCQGVRFKVYVKDGKAALKATPIQDGESS